MSLGLSSSPRHFLRMNFFLLTVPCSFRYLTCALLQQLFQLPTGKWILGQLKCSFDIVTWTINLAGRIILSPVLTSFQPVLIWLLEPYGRQRGSSLSDPSWYILVLSHLARAANIQ